VDARVQDAVEVLNTADGWYPAIRTAAPSVTAPGRRNRPGGPEQLAGRNPVDPA
jgi:hypothetical protein